MGDDSGDDSGDDTGRTAPAAVAGIELRERDSKTMAGERVEILTYAITAEHEPHIVDNEGNEPVFYVFHNVGDASGGDGSGAPRGEPERAVVWLHGGGDEVDTPDLPAPEHCTFEHTNNLAYSSIVNGRKIIPQILAKQQGVLILPVDTWCDMWSGRGPDDPVDPNHQGTVLVQAAVDALVHGIDGIRVDRGRVGLWGSSLGGVGVFPVNQWLGEHGTPVRGLVTDSGPVNMTTMYGPASNISTDYLDHIFGGPPTNDDGTPTEWYPNWARADALALIQDNGLRTPILSTYNTYDEMTRARHGEVLEAALDGSYTPEGLDFFSSNLDHHAPGDQFHTQSALSTWPASYITFEALSFLDGSWVHFYPAQDLCPSTECRLISPATDTKLGDRLVDSEGEDVVGLRAEDPPGMLATLTLPTDLPRSSGIQIIVTVDTAGLASAQPEDPALILRVVDGDTTLVETTLDAREVDGTQNGDSGRLSRIAATTLTLDTGTWAAAVAPQVQIETLQAANWFVDGLWLDVPKHH